MPSHHAISAISEPKRFWTMVGRNIDSVQGLQFAIDAPRRPQCSHRSAPQRFSKPSPIVNPSLAHHYFNRVTWPIKLAAHHFSIIEASMGAIWEVQVSHDSPSISKSRLRQDNPRSSISSTCRAPRYGADEMVLHRRAAVFEVMQHGCPQCDIWVRWERRQCPESCRRSRQASSRRVPRWHWWNLKVVCFSCPACVLRSLSR